MNQPHQRGPQGVRQDRSSGSKVSFDEESLQRFYRRDVLLHEVGHHADRNVLKPIYKREGFAEWFATARDAPST